MLIVNLYRLHRRWEEVVEPMLEVHSGCHCLINVNFQKSPDIFRTSFYIRSHLDFNFADAEHILQRTVKMNDAQQYFLP